MSNGIILLQRPYIAFSTPLLLILRWEITAAAVALFYYSIYIKFMSHQFYHNGKCTLVTVRFTASVPNGCVR